MILKGRFTWDLGADRREGRNLGEMSLGFPLTAVGGQLRSRGKRKLWRLGRGAASGLGLNMAAADARENTCRGVAEAGRAVPTPSCSRKIVRKL